MWNDAGRENGYFDLDVATMTGTFNLNDQVTIGHFEGDANDHTHGTWHSNTDASAGTWEKSTSGDISANIDTWIETGLILFEDDTDGIWERDVLSNTNTWYSEENETSGGFYFDDDYQTIGTWEDYNTGASGTWYLSDDEGLNTYTFVSNQIGGSWYLSGTSSYGTWSGLRDGFMGDWHLADDSDEGTWEFDAGSTSAGIWFGL